MNTLSIISRSNKWCSGFKEKKKGKEEVAFLLLIGLSQTLLTFDDLFFILAVPSERRSTSNNADSEVWFQII